MAGSIDYSVLVDRDAGAFEFHVEYSIPAYIDPETGETFSDTAWTMSFGGGGTGGFGSESAWVPLYLGYPPGEEVSDAILAFSAMNTFSGEAVSREWHIVNAGLAQQPKALVGGSGPDSILGGRAADLLQGLGGGDFLDGGPGGDTMAGGAGDDAYRVDDAADQVVELDAEGYDSVEAFTDYRIGAFVEALALSGVARVGQGNDQANRIDGNFSLGSTLYGHGGDDQLYGYDGDDRLFGGAGDDRLDGGGGSNTLWGGVGDDTYVVGAGTNRLVENAGEGEDEVRVSERWTYPLPAGFERLTNVGDVAAFHGWGNDAANVLTGSYNRDVLDGRAGDDVLQGGGGADWMMGGAGADTLDGGAGDDVVSYARSLGAVFVNLETQVAAGGDAQGDSISSFSGVTGGLGDDTLVGSSQRNVLSGREGDDTLVGAGGNDVLAGGAGADTLAGGDGNDIVAGGAGADRMEGGDGIDTLSYAGSAGGVLVRLGQNAASGGDAEGDQFSGFENLRGSDAGDALHGDASANRMDGAGGADFIDGGGGDDVLRGGPGDDAFYFGPAPGTARVLDFAAGGPEDRISVAPGSFTAFEQVMAVASQVGRNTVLEFALGARLVLVGVERASLTSDDFLFA